MAPLNGVSNGGAADRFIIPADSMHASVPEDVGGRRKIEEASNRSDRRSDRPTATPDGAALSDQSAMDSHFVATANAEPPLPSERGANPEAKTGAPKDGGDLCSGELGGSGKERGSWRVLPLWSCPESHVRRRKFLYCGLVLLGLLLLVFLPVFFCAIAPLIVRSVVSSSRFTVRSTDISKVTPSGFNVQMAIRLLTPPPVGAHVGAAKAIAEWSGRRLGSLDLPEMRLSRNTADIPLDTFFAIEDKQVWAEVSSELLRTGKVYWTISGVTTIKALGMTFNHIPFGMTVDVQGPALMAPRGDGTSPFRVVSLDFGGSDEKSVFMTTVVAFTNESPTAVTSVGDVQFAISYNGIPLSYMRSVRPLSMNRGDNVYVFKGELKPPATAPKDGATDTQDTEAFLKTLGLLMSRSLSGETVDMEAKGIYCSEPLFAPAVASSKFITPIQGLLVAPRMGAPLGLQQEGARSERRSGGPPAGRRAPQPKGDSPIVSMVEGMRFSDLRLAEVPDADGKVALDGVLKARMANPLGDNSPVGVDELSFRADVHMGSVNGPHLGYLSATLLAASPPEAVAVAAPFLGDDGQAVLSPASSLSPPVLSLGEGDGASMTKHPETSGGVSRRLAVATAQEGRRIALENAAWLDAVFTMKGTIELAGDGHDFVGLIRRLALSPSVSLFFINSSLNIKARFALGSLVLPRVQLDHSLEMEGMGSIRDIEVINFSVLGERDGAWVFTTKIRMPSRIPASVPLGPLGIRIAFDGLHMGYLVSNSMVVREGINEVTFAGLLKPEETTDSGKKLSAFFAAAVSSLPPEERPHMEAVLTTEASGAPAFAFLQSLLLSDDDGDDDEKKVQLQETKWVRDAMAGLTLKLPIPSLGSASDLVDSIEIQQIQIDWLATTDYSVPIRGRSVLRLANPLGPRVLIDIQSLSMDAQIAAVIEAEAQQVPTPAGAVVALTDLHAARVRLPLGRMKAQLDDLSCEAAGTTTPISALGPIGSFPAVAKDAGVIEIRAPVQTAVEISEDPEGPHYFGQFVAAFLELQSLQLDVRGAADCAINTPFGPVLLPSVPLKNVIDIPGLGGALSVITVDMFRVLGLGNLETFLDAKDIPGVTPRPTAALDETAPNSILLETTVSLDNPSDPSVELGAMRMLLWHQGIGIGQLQADKVIIRKGINKLDLRGGLLLTKTTAASLSHLFSGVLAETPMTVDVSLQQATLGTGDPLPLWLFASLKSLKLRPQIPPLSALFPGLNSRELLTDLLLDEVSVQFDEDLPDELAVSAKAKATAVYPLGAAVPVEVLGVSFDLVFLAADGTLIGRVASAVDDRPSAALTRIVTTPEGDTRLMAEMETKAIVSLDDGGQALGDWLRNCLQTSMGGPLMFDAKGKASVLLDVGGLGDLLLEGLYVDRRVSFADLSVSLPKEGLVVAQGDTSLIGSAAPATSAAFGIPARNLDPHLIAWQIVGPLADGGGLKFEGVASFLSPFPVETSLPSLQFGVFFEDTLLAVVAVHRMHIQPHPHRTEARMEGRLFRQDTPQGLRDLNNVAAQTLKGVMVGSAGSPETVTPRQHHQGPVLRLKTSVPVSSPAPTWLRVGLKDYTFEVSVSGQELLPASLIHDIKLADTEIDASVLVPSGSLAVTTKVTVVMEAFFGEEAALIIEGLRVDASLVDPHTNKSMARLRTLSSGDGGDTVALETPAVAQHFPEGLLGLQIALKLAIDIHDADTFTAFALRAVEKDVASVRVDGSVSVDLNTPLGLMSLREIQMCQDMPFRGLRGALESIRQGINVLSFSVGEVSLDGPEGVDKLGFVVDVMLEETAKETHPEMVISGGTLTFSLIDATDGVVLGEASVHRAVVGGGSHPMRVSGYLFEPSFLKREGRSRLAAFMTRAINEEPLGVRLRWRDDPNNPRPQWLAAIVNKLDINPTVAGLETTLHLIEGLGFKRLHVGAENAEKIPISALVNVRVRSPLGPAIPIRLQQVSGTVRLFAGEGEEMPMAILPVTSRAPLSQQQQGDVLEVTLQLDASQDALRLQDGGKPFADFLAAQINSGPSSLEYRATVTATVETPFGALGIKDFLVRGTTSLLDAGVSGGGGNGISDIEFSIDAIRFEAPPDGRKALGFVAAVTLLIPMDLTIYLGPMSLQLLFPIDNTSPLQQQGSGGASRRRLQEQQEQRLVPLGVLELPGIQLEGGTARLEARGFIQPAAEDLPDVSVFISRVLSGSSPQVLVKGLDIFIPGGRPAPVWLQTAIKNVSVIAPLPHLEALVASTFSDLQLENMRLAVLPQGGAGGDSGVELGATIKTIVQSPFGDQSPIEIKRVGVDIQLLMISPRKHQQQGPTPPTRRLQQQEPATLTAADIQQMQPVGRLVVREKAAQQVGMIVAIDMRETLSFADKGDAFSQLALQMMQDTAPVRLGVIGTATVLIQSIIGDLHLHGVPLRSVVNIQGLGLFQPNTLGALASSALKSLRISDIKPKGSTSTSNRGEAPSPGALALESTVQLPPVADMEVTLKSLVFSVDFEGETMAAVVVPSMLIKGGGVATLLDLVGIVKPTNNDAFSRLATSFFQGGRYTVSVHGAPGAFEAPDDSLLGLAVSTSGIEGDPPPRWVRQVLAGVEFDVPVVSDAAEGLGGAEQLMKDIRIFGVDVDMSGERNPFVEADLQATYAFPPQFNISHKIKSMDGEFLLFPVNSTEAVARMAMKDLRVLSQSPVSINENRIHLELRPSELDVFPGMEGRFADLMMETVNSKDVVSVFTKGGVRVTVETAVGPLTVAMLMQMTQSIQGLGGLTGKNVSSFFELSNMTVVGADHEFLDAVADVRLRLPGDDCVLGVDLGPIALDIDMPIPSQVLPMLQDIDEEFKEQNVFLTDPLGPLITTGVVKFDRLFIPSPAKRRKMLQAMKDRNLGDDLPPDKAQATLFSPVKTKYGLELKMGTRVLMSNYINAVPTALVIRSNVHTTENKLLIPFFQAFRVETVLQGTDMAFIKEVSIAVKLQFPNLQPIVEAVAVFENPTEATIKFRFAKLETFFQGRSLGPMVIDKRSNPDIIKPKQIGRSSPVPIKPQIKDGTFALMSNVLKSMTMNSTVKPTVQARGEVHIEIETFACRLDIDLPKIPLTLPI